MQQIHGDSQGRLDPDGSCFGVSTGHKDATPKKSAGTLISNDVRRELETYQQALASHAAEHARVPGLQGTQLLEQELSFRRGLTGKILFEGDRDRCNSSRAGDGISAKCG